MKRDRASFTLIELLVVVAVICILIGLIIPALASVREKARNAQCVSNLKQLHTAAITYASDSGYLPAPASYEVFEGGVWVPSSFPGWVVWFSYPGERITYSVGDKARTCVTNGSIYRYIKDTRVYLCPTFAKTANRSIGAVDPVRSYGMNGQAGGSIYIQKNSSMMLLFADQSYRKDAQLEYGNYKGQSPNESHWDLYDGGYWGSGEDRRWFTGGRSYLGSDAAIDGRDIWMPGWGGENGLPLEHLGAYHNGSANCIFVDGHVESISYTSTVAACSGAWTSPPK